MLFQRKIPISKDSLVREPASSRDGGGEPGAVVGTMAPASGAHARLARPESLPTAAAVPAAARSTLTSGPIGRTLFLFSLPILASGVLQSLNASINAVWAGRLLGARALTASANVNSLLFFFIAASMGFGVASSVLIGQGLGAKNMDVVRRTIGTSVIFFAALSIALAAIGILGARPILLAMRTPPDALDLATSYLRALFLALPATYLYTLVMMVLRSAGDTRTPFLFLALSVTLDVGLNPLLIRGFGPIPPLGITGSAYATLIATTTSLVGMVARLYATKHFLRLSGSDLAYLRVDREIVRALVVKGIPMSLHYVVMSSAMIAMISLVNRFGSRTTAAYSACVQLWNYVQMPGVALSTAASSMAAQNIGAKLWDRVARITRTGVLFNAALIGGLLVVIGALSGPAFSLFLGKDVEAIAIARHIHLLVSWSFVLVGMSQMQAGVMRAAGAATPPLVLLFLALWVVRIPFAYGLMPWLGPDAIWWSFGAGGVAAMAMTTLYYRFGRWREARMLS